MASKRIAKSMVDWAAFAESVPKNQLPAYRAFKGRSDAFATTMNSHSQSLPKIDFAEFRSKIALPGLVDSLEKALSEMIINISKIVKNLLAYPKCIFNNNYSGISIPYPTDKSNMVKSIEEQEINAKSKSAKDISALQKEITSLKGLLAKIEAIPGPEKMTYQMAAEYFPDQSRDPVNHPTMWPHDSDSQINGSDKNEIK